jgi:hypothetical protein
MRIMLNAAQLEAETGAEFGKIKVSLKITSVNYVRMLLMIRDPHPIRAHG